MVLKMKNDMEKSNRMKHAVVALIVVVVGLVGFKVLKSSKDDLGRQKPEAPLPMVRVVPVRVGPVDMVLTGNGTAQALTESHIVPQVSGQVVRMSDSFVNGGAFKKGERMLTIEPRDYEIAVTLAGASVKDAESSYEMAQQESQAARREWQRIHPDQPVPSLVAKEPQLAAALANLEAKQASLEKARLNLERTHIVAPFACRISAESVDVGQYVSPGQVLATIYAVDAAEIVMPMDDDDLQWFAVPGFTTEAETGAAVAVRARVAGRDMSWPGRVVRAEGTISEQTRMVNVVVRVDDPYATQPPLAVGQFVTVDISGGALSHATVIPRAALHGAKTVWVIEPIETSPADQPDDMLDTMPDKNQRDKKPLENPDEKPDDGRVVGRIHFRTVDVARMDERGVVVRGGLKDGEVVMISPLKGATDGMKVRFVHTKNRSKDGDAS